VEPAEAAAIFDAGREVVAEVLLGDGSPDPGAGGDGRQTGERTVLLERRRNRSSRNSSQPPSTDRRAARPQAWQGFVGAPQLVSRGMRAWF
jgi:hypothetical protein